MKTKSGKVPTSRKQSNGKEVSPKRAVPSRLGIRELPPIIIGGGGSIIILSDKELETGQGNIAYPFAYTYPDHARKIHHAVTRDKKGKDKASADCKDDGDIIIVFDHA